MRLTLRTLLAYLNDTLDPAQAREIGRKIDESEYATNLTNRIREVVRKRRLLAPGMKGVPPGIDPNLVAEYLDNALAPDRVAQVEKSCLENEVYLAEVAATDQIRTLAVCEPVEVPSGMNNRMYRTNAVYIPATDDAADSPVTNETADAELPRTDLPIIGSSRSRQQARDEFQLSTPVWQRLMPLALIVGLTAAWMWIMVGDPTLFLRPETTGTQDTAANTNDPAESAATDAQNEPMNGNVALKKDATVAAVGNAQPDPMVQMNLEPEPAGGGSGPLRNMAAENIDPPPPGDQKDNVPDMAAADMNGADINGADKPPGDAAVPVPKDAAQKQAPQLLHKSPDQCLLVYDQAAGDWIRRASLSVNEAFSRVAVPEPFHGRFDIADTDARLIVPGGTALQYLPPDENSEFGIYIDRGRIVLSRLATADPKKSLFVHVAARGQAYNVELATPDTIVGLELFPVNPTQFEVLPANGGFQGHIWVASGKAQIKDSADRVVDLAKNQQHVLPFDAPQTADNTQLPGVPQWVATTQPRLASPTMRYADALERELVIDVSATDSVSSLVSDRRPRVAELATLCLVTLEQYEPLVEVLWDSPYEETRTAAIAGLRSWMMKSPDNGAMLQTALNGFFSQADSETVYRLLWSYNEADARDPQKSKELVLLLDNSHISIRQLAFENCFRLTGKTHNYRPSMPISQRNRTFNNWMRFLNRQDGVLIESDE